MRVLHLLDPEVRPAVLLGVAALIDADRARPARDTTHAVCAIGSTSVEAARRFGVDVDHVVPTSATRSTRSWMGLRRWLRGRPAFDRVQAWSLATGELAVSTTRRTPRCVSVSAPPPIETRALPRGVRKLLRDPSTTLLTPGAAMATMWRDAAESSGVARARVGVIEPGVDAGRFADADRRATRLGWGVGDDATSVVATIADAPRCVDALLSMLTVGMAFEAGRSIRLLVMPDAVNMPRAERVVRAAGKPEVMIVRPDAWEPWRTLRGCDMALVLSDGVNLAWAMASGTPIVAPESVAAGTPLVHDDNALLATGKAAPLARQMCKLHDDRAHGHAIGDRARRQAESRFDMTRFHEQMHGAWRGELADGRATRVTDRNTAQSA